MEASVWTLWLLLPVDPLSLQEPSLCLHPSRLSGTCLFPRALTWGLTPLLVMKGRNPSKARLIHPAPLLPCCGFRGRIPGPPA